MMGGRQKCITIQARVGASTFLGSLFEPQLRVHLGAQGSNKGGPGEFQPAAKRGERPKRSNRKKENEGGEENIGMKG